MGSVIQGVLGQEMDSMKGKRDQMGQGILKYIGLPLKFASFLEKTKLVLKPQFLVIKLQFISCHLKIKKI